MIRRPRAVRRVPSRRVGVAAGPAALVLAVVVAAGSAVGTTSAAAATGGTAGPDVRTAVVPRIATLRHPAGPLTPRLAALAATAVAPLSAQAAAVGLAATGPGSIRRDAAGRVLVDVRTAAGTTVPGLDVVASDPASRTTTAWVAPAALAALGRTPGVLSAAEVLTPVTTGDDGPATTDPAPADAGDAAAAKPGCTPVKDEANTQLKAAAARKTYGVDGSGVEVGVLSSSYDRNTADTRSAAQDVAAGELPGVGNPCGRTTPVRVLDDSSASGTDEGRAMLQHVHDLAPGATLAFATASNGLTAFAQNIDALVADGADVISDDVSYYAEPFFQPGPVDAAIARGVAKGVTFTSSAGNNNVKVAGKDVGSYEAPAFRGVPCGGTLVCHDFDAGPTADPNYGYLVPAGSSLTLDLQWAEPWYGVTDDFDLLLTDASGNVVASSTIDNVSTQTPFELARWSNTTSSATPVFAFVARAAGTGNPRLKMVVTGNGAPVSDVEYRTPTGTDVIGPQVFGHNGGADELSTAAVPYSSAKAPETFSSPGPVTYYFGPVVGTTPAAARNKPLVLAKPDVAATDGAATSFFGRLVNGVYRFYGTSAASPHAAAVAALVLQADPGRRPGDVRSVLRSTAVPTPKGTVAERGAGLLDASAALAAVTATATT